MLELASLLYKKNINMNPINNNKLILNCAAKKNKEGPSERRAGLGIVCPLDCDH